MKKKKWPYILVGSIILSLLLAYWGAHFAVGLFDRSAPPEPETTRQTGAVYGYVTEARNRLLPGVPMLSDVSVTLTPGGFTAESDRQGVYYVTDVPPGTYTLTFAKEGYEDFVLPQVRVMAGQAVYLDGSLFPVPQGPASADLRLSTSMGIGSPPDEVPYNSTVYIDAGRSRNASREGFRWEVYDPEGNLLHDPYVTDKPLSPQVSEMPKASPFMFTFEPPGAGDYTVRLYLSNNQYPEESMADVTVSAVNVAPIALPRVYPAPIPPQKGGTGELAFTSGAQTVAAGETVYLRGFALDDNYPTPEDYNPHGIEPDIYGLNNDHYQSAFSWEWRLELENGGNVHVVDSWLMGEDGSINNTSQHSSFTAQEPGTYRAYLTVSDNDPYGPLVSEEAVVEILALPADKAYVGEDRQCLECHDNMGQSFHSTASVTCESCHGPGQAHLDVRRRQDKLETISVSYDAGTCGQCHEQYYEWEKSMHSDGYAFGFNEIAQPLLLTCGKCHYPQGFIRTTSVMEQDGVGFKDVSTMKPMFPAGPMFFDFSALPVEDGESISCVTCHDPHGESTAENPVALRLGSADALCATCHEEKWHNAIMRGIAGEMGSAYEYPGGEYDLANPHLTEESCVRCHMDTTVDAVDQQGTREVGGHTLRMRAIGAGETLGGYGPSADNGDELRGGEIDGNVLNTGACVSCHGQTEMFNLNNVQAENFNLWLELGDALRGENHGELPDYKPGDKCATCHRGGTLPFEDDPDLVLENAYSNYKLVGSDRSWGIHNPGYIRQLLIDALESLR
ncbi:carboxypeptidase regulatory-like domain-containing protein [Dethiobacter alkaliphilus]|uniref:carboxypeptidase regulatory-like domain-containing protein n=1 Tax=Dethiobacter alkaliphilus TaxID=427926 RepID=UPI002226CAAA|nr:carboxypeptidase regulatory-like domain-containing protein [Dethiobacter alkaliphilus]MCW3490431.1 carboxypeptidase regulatory-like domain-containing protein [Dethiobacter alkaliphilus]